MARSRQHHCLTCPSAVTAGFLTTPFLSGVTSTAIFANIGDEVMAHNGFLSAYLSVRTAILALLKTLTSSRGDGPWTFYVTGHSLGGALATIFAYECAELKMGEVVVYTYGSPRVGNAAFVESFHRLVGKVMVLLRPKDLTIILLQTRMLSHQRMDQSGPSLRM